MIIISHFCNHMNISKIGIFELYVNKAILRCEKMVFVIFVCLLAFFLTKVSYTSFIVCSSTGCPQEQSQA